MCVWKKKQERKRERLNWQTVLQSYVVWEKQLTLQTCLSARHLRFIHSISSESVAGTEPKLRLNSCPVLRSEPTHSSSCAGVMCGCHAEPRSCVWMLESTSFPATSRLENRAGPTSLSSRRVDGLPNAITHWQNNYLHSHLRAFTLTSPFRRPKRWCPRTKMSGLSSSLWSPHRIYA